MSHAANAEASLQGERTTQSFARARPVELLLYSHFFAPSIGGVETIVLSLAKGVVLLLIGNDWRVKGLPAVLDAMGALGGSSLHLIVVGNDAPESFCESARQLGIFERCHFELPRREVLDLYAAADLYVSPSLEDSFVLPVAEAMACGLPVITSPSAGVSEYLENGQDGFVLSDSKNWQELAHLIQCCIQDGELRSRIGAAAARLAASWTWERNLDT